MFSKIFKVTVITFGVFSLSVFIVFTASYFHYSDAVDKQLCDELLVDFVYYAERCLYIWTVFNFIEIMILLVVLLIYKTLFWSLIDVGYELDGRWSGNTNMCQHFLLSLYFRPWKIFQVSCSKHINMFGITELENNLVFFRILIVIRRLKMQIYCSLATLKF